MNLIKIKKVLILLLILAGAALLIIQIALKEKNYYLQSIGVVSLMLGLFMVNANLTSKTQMVSEEFLEEEE